MKKTITKTAIMKIAKITVAVATMWVMPKMGMAQKYYYNGTGTPDAITSWVDSVGMNPTSFSAAPKATFIFGALSGGTTVHIPKSVSITGSVIDSINLIVDSGAVFTISGGKLTVRPKTDSMIVLGTLIYDTRTAATLTGKLHISNGGTLTLTRNITNIPAAAFDTLSNLIIGDGTDSITALPKMVSKGVYGNVTINAPAVISSFGAKFLPNTAGTYTILGDFNILAGRVTNSNSWPKKVAKTLNVDGNLNVNGGTYIICDSSSSNDKIKVLGDINVMSGALFTTNNFIDTLIGRGKISVEGDLIHSGGLFGNATTSKVGGKILFSTTDTAGQAFSSIGFNNSGITTTIQAGGTSGILQVKNSSGTVGNVYDDTINPPPSGGGGSSVAQKSWINAPQTALQGNSPHSIHFTVSDASQSYNTGNFKITPVTVAGYTSGTYYCYQNSSSNPLPLSGSLNVSFSGTENTYLGLACCYIPANAVSNGTGNESFNPWINLINAIWSYYTGNQPGWQNITFNTVLQPNDYITFFALSNNNTAMCNPLPAVFGVPAININSRLTILQHL